MMGHEKYHTDLRRVGYLVTLSATKTPKHYSNVLDENSVVQ
jgi:hypothetical protein